MMASGVPTKTMEQMLEWVMEDVDGEDEGVGRRNQLC